MLGRMAAQAGSQYGRPAPISGSEPNRSRRHRIDGR
jgi:hypothetical protein